MAFRRASMSLNGTCSNPGTSGSNGSRKSFRQVALSAPIVRPWKPRIAAMIFFLRVEARANLIAASTASEPELLRKTRPRFPGATERSFSTKAAFAVVPNTGPTWISSRAWASIASTMAGLQCPRLPTPKDAPQSMYSLPSSSQSVATDPRTNVGPRFGAHPNSIARASGTLTRSPSPFLRAPARPGPAEGTMRSPRAPRRPGGLVLHEEQAAVVHGPHGLLAAAEQETAVDPAQADGGRSERLQPGHDRRVQLPGEGHREDLHRGEVRVPRDDAARGGDPADRPAEGLREPIHLVRATVNEDVIATGREVDQHVVDPVPFRTAYLDD